jgi:L-ascorbate metabolism protein UlaG (beta-lactamase superfamily)
MSDSIVKINYLYHSSFAVETKNYLMIFDYYRDSVEKGEKRISNGAIGVEDLKTNKKVIVFSSHSHGDHFNPLILEWSHKRKDISYVLSSDIKISERNENIHILSTYDEVKVGDAYIKAYGSTDLGISFLVKVDGVSIFHAGDLNWWYWWDDTKEEIEKMENWFKDEISKMKEEVIDIAFFPVDQRLKHNYCLGAKYFIEELEPKVLLPMHFGDEFGTTKKFAEEMEGSLTKIIEVTHRGQEILY